MSPEDGHEAPGHRHDARPGQPGTHAAFTGQLDAVLEAYLGIQSALADDDDAAAAAAADRMRAALAAVDMGLLEGPAHRVWMASLQRLRRTLAPVAGAPDIAARRTAFLPLTEALWAALSRFGHGRPEPVRLFHCPMANQSQGADWIQMGRTTDNPYYGATMLRCGSQTDSLAARPPEGP